MINGVQGAGSVLKMELEDDKKRCSTRTLIPPPFGNPQLVEHGYRISAIRARPHGQASSVIDWFVIPALQTLKAELVLNIEKKTQNWFTLDFESLTGHRSDDCKTPKHHICGCSLCFLI